MPLGLLTRMGKMVQRWWEEAKVVVNDVVTRQVSVRDLKTHLSEWLARAQAGEVVEVTSHPNPSPASPL